MLMAVSMLCLPFQLTRHHLNSETQLNTISKVSDAFIGARARVGIYFISCISSLPTVRIRIRMTVDDSRVDDGIRYRTLNTI